MEERASQNDLELELDAASRELPPLERRSRHYSAVRFVSFLAAFVGLIGAAGSPIWLLALTLPGLIVFAIAFSSHTRILDRIDEIREVEALLREEVDRRRSRRRSRPLPPRPAGDAHPLARGLRMYAPEPESWQLDSGAADDLAVLEGSRSLFGLLDVSSTIVGAERLRTMLEHPLRSTADIRVRQAAVRALADRNDVRRAILRALLPLRRSGLADLPSLLGAPVRFADRALLLFSVRLLGTAAPLLLLASLHFQEALPLAIATLVINLAIIGKNVREANPARDRLLAFRPAIDGLMRLEEALEAAELGTDPTWNGIHGSLRSLRPSLQRLRRWLRRLALHDYGILFEVINIPTLWELRSLPPAEHIFETERSALEQALGALGETEALTALAGLLAEQPDFILPAPLEGPTPRVEGDGVGHPLLDRENLVRNPVRLAEGENVLIVTGSNMAGKSTYLKSIGANILLAGIGGPVCARAFRWTPLRIHTDINVRDSLDDGKSYFQVEVERVQEVLRVAERDRRVLAIFDELFRGTNAEERLSIARSLLKHLRSRGILVVVATHDGALTRLVTADDESGMKNVHFRETVSGRAMTFDYRLHEGPAPTRNAIRVLEAAGYPKDVIEGALEERESDGAEKS